MQKWHAEMKNKNKELPSSFEVRRYEDLQAQFIRWIPMLHGNFISMRDAFSCFFYYCSVPKHTTTPLSNITCLVFSAGYLNYRTVRSWHCSYTSVFLIIFLSWRWMWIAKAKSLCSSFGASCQGGYLHKFLYVSSY